MIWVRQYTRHGYRQSPSLLAYSERITLAPPDSSRQKLRVKNVPKAHRFVLNRKAGSGWSILRARVTLRWKAYILNRMHYKYQRQSPLSDGINRYMGHTKSYLNFSSVSIDNNCYVFFLWYCMGNMLNSFRYLQPTGKMFTGDYLFDQHY